MTPWVAGRLPSDATKISRALAPKVGPDRAPRSETPLSSPFRDLGPLRVRHRVCGVTAQPESLPEPPAHRGPGPLRPPRPSTSYDVRLDLAADDATFGSVTTSGSPRAAAARSSTSSRPGSTRSALNGARWTPTCSSAGRLPLETVEGEQRAGRRRGDARSATTARACTAASTRPTASTTSTACRSWTRRRASSPASTSPTSRRRTRFHVIAPADWVVVGNAPGSRSSAGARLVGVRADASRCRRTSSPWSPAPTTSITRRARRHPARPVGAREHRARPRRGRRRAVHA